MIEKILKDWKKRVGNNLNYKNTDHLFELGSMLTEQGWDSETIGILIENLKEIDIVRKKQPDGSFGSAYTVKKHNPDRGQQLIKKDASPEDLDKVDKGEPIDTDDEESIDDLIQADHQSADDSLNMTKTRAKEQAKEKGKKDVGLGTPESRAGEAMVHKGLRLLKEGKSLEEIEKEFTKLVNSDDHILNSTTGKKWVGATMATLKKIDERIGIKNIETISWDTDQGRKSIGVAPNLETSSDMFVKTKDGRVVGISLKKDGVVFLNNGGWAVQSKKLVESLRGTMPDEDLQKLEKAMSLKEYNDDLLQRIQSAAEKISVSEIKDGLKKLRNADPTPSVFKGKNKDIYFDILSKPEELIEKIKSGKLKGNDVKAFTKLLQVYHKEEYKEIRKIDDNLTKRAFDAINDSEDAKKGMKKHIIKSLHIAETLGLNEETKKGGVDGFITTYGIEPDGAVLNEETLSTLLGSKFQQVLAEKINEVRNGDASTEDLNKIIEESIEIDYESGMILFRHENNKKYPLFYMTGRSRGIGSSPVMELAQTPLMAHSLKQGTFDTDDWDEKSLKRFENDIKDIED